MNGQNNYILILRSKSVKNWVTVPTCTFRCHHSASEFLIDPDSTKFAVAGGEGVFLCCTISALIFDVHKEFEFKVGTRLEKLLYYLQVYYSILNSFGQRSQYISIKLCLQAS